MKNYTVWRSSTRRFNRIPPVQNSTFPTRHFSLPRSKSKSPRGQSRMGTCVTPNQFEMRQSNWSHIVREALHQSLLEAQLGDCRWKLRIELFFCAERHFQTVSSIGVLEFELEDRNSKSPHVQSRRATVMSNEFETHQSNRSCHIAREALHQSF